MSLLRSSVHFFNRFYQYAAPTELDLILPADAKKVAPGYSAFGFRTFRRRSFSRYPDLPSRIFLPLRFHRFCLPPMPGHDRYYCRHHSSIFAAAESYSYTSIGLLRKATPEPKKEPARMRA